MAEHAPLPPSFAPVWAHCSAAVMAALQAPQLDSEASREGTAAHWVVSSTLEGWRDGNQLHPRNALGVKAPNGVVVDEKIIEGAQTMIDDVLEVAKTPDLAARLLVEHRVCMPHIHEQNWGTLDAGLYLPERKVLFIWDYKHGHRECRARENWQLIDYAEGLRHKFAIDGIQDQELTVVFRIVQPFCYRNSGPIDEWTCKLSDLRGHANRLRNQAVAAFTNPTLTSGQHCRDCPARGTCPGARRASYNLIDVVNEPYATDNMTAVDLATEWRILQGAVAATRARLEAIEDEIKHRLSNGEAGTGLALESTYGRLAWSVPPQQAAALAQQFGFDISTFDVQTPTQAKQAAPREVRQQFETVLETVTKRPATGMKLTDARDSITAKAFKRK